MKICRRCSEPKASTEFRASKQTKDGLFPYCKTCLRVYERDRQKRRRAEDPNFMRKQNLYTKYKLRWDEYLALIEDQQSRCATCDVDLDPTADAWQVPHVDHDHATGEIRGVLCRPCNHILGHAKDNPATLRRLANYLEAKLVI